MSGKEKREWDRFESERRVSEYYEDLLHAIMVRFDQLEARLEDLTNKIITEVDNGNKPKNHPLDEFFSTFCALKAWDKDNPSARAYKSSLNWFFSFVRKRDPKVKSLREITPIMVSEYIKYHKGRRIFSKRRNQWEKLSERTINTHIKKLRHAFEIVDSKGTQQFRERLITIKKPKLKKNVYIPSDEELARIPEMLKILRKGDSERNKYLAFIAATVLQFCGRTHALSGLRFDMVDGLEEGEKPVVVYVGKHGVEQVKGITNAWYRDFLKEWKEHVKRNYGNAPYFFPMVKNGQVKHMADRTLRYEFKKFMRMCGLPQLTVHSFRYIYATKLYLKGVPQDAIKDILGVEKRTLKYYIKAMQERKRRVLFTHLEKISALPKGEEK